MVRLSDFDYDLPEELIAQTPLADRAASRLLHLDPESSEVHHRMFRDVVEILQPGDVLVLNDTRVNAWRFHGRKETGGEVEILALKELEPGVFEALVKPARRLKPGAKFTLGEGVTGQVLAEGDDPTRIVKLESQASDLYKTLSKIGEMPLPPYITERLDDSERYQTVFGQSPGSAAAPTAGLHFTDEILDQLKAKGIAIATVTLHVGIDTFRPVQVEDISQHKMHGEVCEITPEAAKTINQAQGRVIAVGTTAVRTLETRAISCRKVQPGRQESRIFITPGYEFKIVDGMFTNFHLPQTTMLLMISALASKNSIFEAYRQAIELKYRFLSFGDSMLLLKSSGF
ncbi:MAG: tRNA preQ1(34) S-adenosylmethionine ribosyltransferase-isomerase QueA [Armatimonadetes bacterium]|nr:tRNA preQ1(34) S-adenosylmethionine ribosyltransferase-isomerase QueA [Armatimonadota bacterium]